ncbi:MAG: DSD1 family PLP-dependent enzyme [Chloroflexota bacterium]|nr:DSD1 family PLP-dependent enzyme [Chloroflexia bacterium]MDQ3225391.1 DSD1 family PLP-dependent enzyme [Chloroflexota bacterium]
MSDLDTPALLVDIETMDRNIAHIARTLREHGVQWRPHAKGHKTPAIAHRQIAAGAIGVTVAKVSEAEVMAASGIMDILIANQVVGPIKTRRLAALIASTGADVIVAIDNPANVRELDDAAAAFGVRPRAVVEVDSGMKRCGVAPGEPTIDLARMVDQSPNLRFAGLMAWEGHTVSMADHQTRGEEIAKAVGRLTGAADEVRAAGLPVDIVSCGGSGTYLYAASQPGVTEVQAGGATMGDGFYRALESPVEPALTIMTTVTSRPAEDRVILDAGRRAIDPSQKAPTLRGVDGVQGIKFSAEHGVVALDGPSEWPHVGDRLELEVNYTDQAVHLHESLFGIRDGVIAAVWPVACRGRMQ